jgi:nucleoside-diphosphate-sugar epimerase
MASKRILHIGQGFIGSRVISALVDSGNHVGIFDLPQGDLRDRKAVYDTIKDYDEVVLMAAIANLNDFEKDPLLGMDINIGGLINVVDACSKLGKKLYFISTCCVYGNTPDLPSNEESRVAPSEIYAAAKYAGEWIIKGYNKSFGLRYLIMRIATCYGPGMRAALAPAVFINQVKRGEPLTIHGDGSQTRTLTYIDDEVSGIVTLINSNIDNETFNVSTEEEKSVNELVDIIKGELGVPKHPGKKILDRVGQTFKEQIDTGKIREVRVWLGRYAPDPHKINGRTGWEAKVSLREGIRRTLKWMKENNMEEIK